MNVFLLMPVLALLEMPGCAGLWTVGKLTVKSGGSITIPCHYHSSFKEKLKYWCKGRMWHTCLTVREREGKTAITDSPGELVTTLTLTSLKSSDAGHYWCAVKIKDFMKPDRKTSLELLVTEDTPDLWVGNNMVTGPEGGNVTVDCFYNNRLNESEKKWCQSGDLHSCKSERDIQPTQQTPLWLRDNGQGQFSVTLTGLQRKDAGWYWCMVDGIQAPVHLTVTTVTTPATTQPSTALPELTSSSLGSTVALKPVVISRQQVWLVVLVTAGVLLTAVALTVVFWRRWKQRNFSEEPHLRAEETDSADSSIKDDVDLLDYEWTSTAALQLNEEPNATETP